MAREIRAFALVLLAAGTLACASTRATIAERLFASDEQLVFDRSSRLLPPEGLRITSNQERQMVLAWEPVLVSDVAGYAILQRRLTPSLPMVEPLQDSYFAWLMKYHMLKPAYLAVLRGRV